jgi:3-oxoacyl-(acyl-carrier-protein) synthase/NAD(P)-dependent dehydrogenase (short-subunit alcohol dehydrogenase family)
MRSSIAVIGMGCIFPDAMDLSEYWSNIVSGRDSIGDVPDSYWLMSDYYDKDKNKRDKTYSKKAGILNDIAFNPLEFGVMPNDLESISVDQLFALVVAKQALQDAGMYGDNAKSFDRNKTGVILAAGIGKNAFSLNVRLQIPKFRKILLNSGVSENLTEVILNRMADAETEWTENSNPGYLPNVVAGRVASRFNFYGTNCTVDAACASSLAALKCAINELENGDCDVMLTGGVNLDCSEFSFVSFCKTPAISPSDTIRPFDKDSDGMVLGDGVGMLVLKRLSDAERDNDKIYGVIKGIGSSGDGRAKGIFAPSVDGQIKALQRTYEKTDINPGTISLIEAHGTGTKVGDNYELEALKKFFINYDLNHEIGIGSVKSQIGHTRLSAGIASLIKVLLALHHKVQPGTLHVDNPSEVIEDSYIKVINKTRPWIINEQVPVRRAGVSAFGFGGTNYHVVVEEWNSEQKEEYRLNKNPTSIVIDGKTVEEVSEKCKELREELLSNKKYNLNDYYGKVLVLKKDHRIGFVVTSVEDAIDKLTLALDLLEQKKNEKKWESNGIFYRKSSIKGKEKIAALLWKPGMQMLNKYHDIAINYPEMREAFRKADNVRLKSGEQLISKLVYPYEKQCSQQDNEKNEISNALMIEGTISAGLYKILRERGLEADYYIGWDMVNSQIPYASGNLNENEYFKQIQKASKKLKNKDKEYGELKYRKTGAIVYEQESGERYPEPKKQQQNKKSKKTLDDCIQYVSKKGTTIFLDLGAGIERSQIKEYLQNENIEVISFCSNDFETKEAEMESALMHMRVLGIGIKKDKYAAIPVDGKDDLGKHFITVNPRIYRSGKKEKIVHDAINVKTSECEKKQADIQNTLSEKSIKEVETSINKEVLTKKSEKTVLPAVKTVNKKNEDKKDASNKIIKKNNIDYVKKTILQDVNKDAFLHFINSQRKDFELLKHTITTGSSGMKLENMLAHFKDSEEGKLDEFKSFLNRQNELFFSLEKDSKASEADNKKIAKIKSGMRALQLTLKEAELEKGSEKLQRGLSLVVLDRDGVALQVCNELKRNGFIPVLLDMEGIGCDSVAYPVHRMDSLHETDIKNCFEVISNTYKQPLTGFMYISSKPKAGTSMKCEFDVVKAIFLSAKNFYLYSSKNLEQGHKKFFINVVRMDGKVGTTGNGENLVLGGLFGLGKSLEDEWRTHTIVKTIDVQSECSSQKTTQFVMQELLSMNSLYPEIGRRKNGKRYFIGLKETEGLVAAKNVPDDKDVFLVSGGGHGITAKCIIRLGEKYHCKFILLGRTVLKDDVSWLQHCKTKREVQEAVIARMRKENKKMKPNEVAVLVKEHYGKTILENTMSQLKDAGSEAAYYTCNVTSEEEVKKVIEDATLKFGQITGFIHGAGVLADKYIHDKVEEDFDLVAGTKIFGLNACLNNLNLDKMKYIILYSSVAAFFGNKGQTDYSIANEVLNKMSYLLKRSYPSCKTVSINWGPWDGGMIDKSLKEALAARDISVIPIERGIDLFMEQFVYEQKKEQAQIVVFDKMYF